MHTFKQNAMNNIWTKSKHAAETTTTPFNRHSSKTPKATNIKVRQTQPDFFLSSPSAYVPHCMEGVQAHGVALKSHLYVQMSCLDCGMSAIGRLQLSSWQHQLKNKKFVYDAHITSVRKKLFFLLSQHQLGKSLLLPLTTWIGIMSVSSFHNINYKKFFF